MEALFTKLIEISMIASLLILIILILRICFKKASKSFYCFLWALVGLRLVFPFSIESIFSLIPRKEMLTPTIQTGILSLNQTITQNNLEEITISQSSYWWTSLFTYIWILGMAVLFIYSIISYYRLYKKVSISLPYKKNIYYCDNIDSPFILGIIQPKIYLPSTLNESQIEYVLKHENAHLKRKDHLWKPLGFVLLTIYWFNPMIWIAYICLCKDIESACDEYVIEKMDSYHKKMYSETLFSCSVDRKLIMACPLAFGEIGVKERIKSIVNYKKPSFWVLCLSLIACIVLSIGFLTEPKSVTDFTFTSSYLNKKVQLSNKQMKEVLNHLDNYSFNHKSNNNFDEHKYFITYNKDKLHYQWTITKGKTELAINDGEKTTIFVGDDPTLLNVFIKYEPLAQNNIKIEPQNVFNLNTTSFTSKLTNTILDQQVHNNPAGTIRIESHIVLANEQMTPADNSNKIIETIQYLVVLYQEFNVIDNKPVEIYRSYFPAMITLNVNKNEYSLKDYWQPVEGDDYENQIKERFPGDSANDAINSQKYLEELEEENLQKVNDYLETIQLESKTAEAFNELYSLIKPYDNGYTDEDYNNAEGEACLHDRGTYQNESIPYIKVNIQSDTHRLFTYIVYVYNLFDNTYEKVYIDVSNYFEIQDLLKERGYEVSW